MANWRDFLGISPYAVSDVLRNRRRTVSAILGVLLAVTFVAGTFIAIDSSARATLDATLLGIPGDFGFYLNALGPDFNTTNLMESLLSTAGVVNASVYENLPVWNIENTTVPTNSSYPQYITTYAIDPTHLPNFFKDASVTGSFNLLPQQVGLSKDFASSLGVRIGDRVIAVNQVNETVRTTANLTVGALVDPASSGQPYFTGGSPGPILYGSFAFIPLRDVNWLLSQLNQSSFGHTYIGEVWIDRAHYVNPYDIDATRKHLLVVERRLHNLLGDAYVTDNILSRIENFASLVELQRIQYLLLSMPVLLLGVYLGAVGVDLSHAERRRELAVLKTRGARRGQLIALLLLEAVVGGLIAAVVGLIAGVGLSRLLLGVLNPLPGAPLPYEAFILTPDTVLVVAFLSVALMAGVTYRSAKRTAGLPIIETLRYYAPGETKLHYNPRTDIILVTVGIADYALVWWRGGTQTSILTFLLGFIPFLLLPFVPLLLIIGLTRLLTRSTGKVYDWFSRAAKPFTKDLYYVIRRNLMRNPRRSANVAIIIALGLAFGVFSLSILATNAAHDERAIRATVGADMSVTPRDFRNDLTANLSAVPGVQGVSKVVGLDIGAQYGTTYALDPDSYFAVAQPEGWYFADGNPAHGHQVLNQLGNVLISQASADQSGLEVGDRLSLYGIATYENNGTYAGTVRENVTVGGIVQFLPGFFPYYYGFNTQRLLFASRATLQPFLDPAHSHDFSNSASYLVDLGPSADWRTVKADVQADVNVGFVTVAQEILEAQTSNPFARALYGFIDMEIAFIVVILTAGVGLILFAASLERDVEFAAIIARGASGWQTAKLLVGEAFVIMLVGLTIGVGVGLGTAFIATQWLATGPGGVQISPVPYFFVFPWDALLLVTLGPIAILLASLLVSVRVAHINVAQVLKLRGG